MSPQYLRQLGEMAPKVALNLWNSIRFGAKEGVRQAARSVGLESGAPDLHRFTLADVADHTDKPFFDEDNLLTLAARLLELGTENWPSPLTPWQITCKVNPEEGFPFGRLDSKTVEITGASPRAAHLFAASTGVTMMKNGAACNWG